MDEKNFSINFLLGMPRSGTSSVMSYLRGHPDIETGFEEPDHLYRLMKSQKWYEQYEQYLGVPAKHVNKITFDAYRVYTKHFYSQLCIVTGKKLVVLKHPLLSSYADYLRKIFPKGKFIILVRHPYDVVASISYFRTVNSAIKATFPAEINQIAKTYATYMGRLKTLTDMVPDRVSMVKFEDFLESPEDFLGKIFEFLDCKLSDSEISKIIEQANDESLCRTSRVVTQTKLFNPEERHLKLSSEDKRAIKDYAISYMTLFNYKEK